MDMPAEPEAPYPSDQKFRRLVENALKLGDFPSPKYLLVAMGSIPEDHKYRHGARGPNLNGRQCAIRAEVLRKAGFVKDSRTGRWLATKKYGPNA